MAERSRHESGTFCWVGLATSDPAAAERFYTSLFGWEAQELSAGAAGAFTMLRRAGAEVALLYRQQPDARAVGTPPHWTLLHLGRRRRRDRRPGRRAWWRCGVP